MVYEFFSEANKKRYELEPEHKLDVIFNVSLVLMFSTDRYCININYLQICWQGSL